ncbi:MAG: hypothetical protein U5L04_00430 [Trueperaceae bacterium]|nr:hypothetical protein [Trueperaceae bacterium]
MRYTAEVPADAEPGTHWSVLFLEGEDPNPQPGFRLAAFNVRVGHTIYVNVPPIVREGVIGGIFGERIASPVDAFRLYPVPQHGQRRADRKRLHRDP